MIFSFRGFHTLIQAIKWMNKFLLAGDKFMPEMHLRQPGFTYSICWPFTKNKERIHKLKGIGNSRYTYQKEPVIRPV